MFSFLRKRAHQKGAAFAGAALLFAIIAAFGLVLAGCSNPAGSGVSDSSIVQGDTILTIKGTDADRNAVEVIFYAPPNEERAKPVKLVTGDGYIITITETNARAASTEVSKGSIILSGTSITFVPYKGERFEGTWSNNVLKLTEGALPVTGFVQTPRTSGGGGGGGGGGSSSGTGTVPGTGVSPFTVPLELRGEWVAAYGETFVISDTTYSSGTGSGGYAGTIVNHSEDGFGAGYITIKYTAHDNDSSAVGKYYVIHYENLVSSTVFISGAAPGIGVIDPDFNYPKGGGKATQTEAEETYTVANSYFEGGSSCKKLSGQSFSNKLEGAWQNGSGMMAFIFTITDKTVQYSYIAWTYAGEIVDVVDNGATGYIVFRYLFVGTGMANQNLVDKYTVLYWENYDGTSGTANMAHGRPSNSGWSGISVGTALTAGEAVVDYIDSGVNLYPKAFTLQP